METLNLKYNLRHNEIIDDSPPTLFHFASLKVAKCLWYAETFVNWSFDEDHERVGRIYDKISKLLIPETIKDDVALTVIIIEDQLNSLRFVLKKVFSRNNNYFFLRDKIYWTSQCTIDEIKTAEALANCSDLDIETRFKIAAFYNLKREINCLSVQLSQDFLIIDEEICHNIFDLEGVSIARQHFKVSKVRRNFKQCFELSILLGNRNELKCHYYWEHLTEIEKNDVYMHFDLRHIMSTKLALFFFTEANVEQKRNFLQNKLFCSMLFENFLGLHWLRYFCTKVSKVLPEESLILILGLCEPKVTYGRSYVHKKIFTQVFCVLLRILYELNPNPTDWTSVTYYITSLMNNFILYEEEITFANMILKSMPNEWIEKWYSALSDEDLIEFLNDKF